MRTSNLFSPVSNTGYQPSNTNQIAPNWSNFKSFQDRKTKIEDLRRNSITRNSLFIPSSQKNLFIEQIYANQDRTQPVSLQINPNGQVDQVEFPPRYPLRPVQPCQSKDNWKKEYAYLPEVCIKAGWNLWNILPSDPTTDNLVFSPLAVFSALAPLIRGTDGSTNEQIINALKMSKYILEDKKRSAVKRKFQEFRYNHMLQSLAASGALTALDQMETQSTEYSLATGLYLSHGLEFDPYFGYDVRKVMMSKLRRLNFSNNQESLNLINGFFNNSTRGKIPKMVSSVDPNTKLIILSALFLKAKWTNQFNTRYSETGIFYDQAGTALLVNYMTAIESKDPRTRLYNHVILPENLGDALQIPLGPKECKQQFMFNIFRPASYDKLKALEIYLRNSTVNNDQAFLISDIFKNSTQIRIKRLTIPKFKIETSLNLKDSLRSLGITEVFERGNFSRMLKNSTSNFFVSSANHRSVFEIDENGIEGAAATAVTITQRSAYMYDDKISLDEWKVKNCFLFSVTEVSTDMTLFMGRINIPDLAVK